MHVVSGLEEWANAIVELAPMGPLPERWVVVPNRRVAAALARLFRARGERAALLGTRFLTLVELAREILLDAGEQVVVRSAPVTELLVRDAIEQLEFEYFEPDALGALSAPEQLARTIDELASAGLSAASLFEQRDPKLRDLGRIAARLERAEAASVHALLERAAKRACTLEGRPPTLAIVTGDESVAEAALLRAIPNLSLACWRPSLPENSGRLQLLFGSSPAPFTTARRDAKQPPGERGRAKRVGSARSARRVRLATHDGPQEEVDAAVAWAHGLVTEAGYAPSEIAILAPFREPYGALLRARLRSHDAPPRLRVYCEGGVPLAERGGGSRLARLIAALRKGLPARELAALLPELRSTSPGELLDGASARALLQEVNARGGEPADLRAGRAWPEAWEEAILRLERESRALSGRDRAHRRAVQSALAARAHAVEALTDVLRHVIAGAPLGMVWMCLSTFASAQLRRPPGTATLTVLERAVEAFTGYEEHEPCGEDALAWLARTIATSVRDVRSGGEALYFGSVEDARALSFRAVRILGLSEQAFATRPREASLLADAERRALSPLLVTCEDRLRRREAALVEALAVARAQLVLSAPCTRAGAAERPHALFRSHSAACEGGAPRASGSRERRLAAASDRARHGSADVSAESTHAVSERKLPGELARAVKSSRKRRAALAGRGPADTSGEPPEAAAFDATVRRALALMLMKRANNPDGATRLAARASGLEERVAVATDHVGRAYDALASAGLLGLPLRLSYALPDEHGAGSSACDVVIAMPRALVAIALVTDGPNTNGSEAARAHARALAHMSAGVRVRAASLSSHDGSLHWLE